ncbi:MAG: hypothetical protein MJB14_16070, partial [Spirochaetes bacterium]|nr:hypothetical protein [Spirochaetota bacterium]
HNEHTRYIDEQEHDGEEVIITEKVKVNDVKKGSLRVEAKLSYLLEELVSINHKDFQTVKVKYEARLKKFFLTLEPIKSVRDLTKLYQPGDTLECIKTTVIFGSPNAVVEKMIANRRPMFYKFTDWKTAEVESEDQVIILKSKLPLILDMVFEVKNSPHLTKGSDYIVKKIKRENQKYYNYLQVYYS